MCSAYGTILYLINLWVCNPSQAKVNPTQIVVFANSKCVEIEYLVFYFMNLRQTLLGSHNVMECSQTWEDSTEQTDNGSRGEHGSFHLENYSLAGRNPSTTWEHSSTWLLVSTDDKWMVLKILSLWQIQMASDCAPWRNAGKSLSSWAYWVHVTEFHYCGLQTMTWCISTSAPAFKTHLRGKCRLLPPASCVCLSCCDPIDASCGEAVVVNNKEMLDQSTFVLWW